MRSNFQLGDSIHTYDPGVALRGENGTFRVTTPGGEELFITCTPGAIANLHWADSENKRPFLVTKISEPVTLEGTAPLRKVG